MLLRIILVAWHVKWNFRTIKIMLITNKMRCNEWICLSWQINQNKYIISDCANIKYHEARCIRSLHIETPCNWNTEMYSAKWNRHASQHWRACYKPATSLKTNSTLLYQSLSHQKRQKNDVTSRQEHAQVTTK